MNATFEREFTSRRYYSERKTEKTVSFSEIIILLISALFAFLAKENVKTVIRVTVSLACLAGLYSVVHFVEVCTLSAFPAILIALALLGTVAFCFRNER